jgi:hypothetical protein
VYVKSRSFLILQAVVIKNVKLFFVSSPSKNFNFSRRQTDYTFKFCKKFWNHDLRKITLFTICNGNNILAISQNGMEEKVLFIEQKLLFNWHAVCNVQCISWITSNWYFPVLLKSNSRMMMIMICGCVYE